MNFAHIDSPPSLEGWDIRRDCDVDWIPWGPTGDARAKILGVADGFHVVLVKTDPGYTAAPHGHDYPEFLYVLDGSVQNQGVQLSAGDAYAAAAGSSHTDFCTTRGATHLTVFKV